MDVHTIGRQAASLFKILCSFLKEVRTAQNLAGAQAKLELLWGSKVKTPQCGKGYSGVFLGLQLRFQARETGGNLQFQVFRRQPGRRFHVISGGSGMAEARLDGGS